MESHFDKFLERYYIDPEPIITILKEHDWFNLIAIRYNHIIVNKAPKYATVVISLLQPIQDKLRRFENINEKKQLEEEFGYLFRNMIGDLFQNKIGFHEEFPNIIQELRVLYQMNGDDFDELDRLIGLSCFLENLKHAKPIEDINYTRRLEWLNENITLTDVDLSMKKYGVLTENSKFEDLFVDKKEKELEVPAKYLKSFTLLVGKFCDNGWIKSIGGKSRYKFIQDNLKIQGRLKPLSKNYMRQTISNFKDLGIGEKKYVDFINRFMDEIDDKNVQ